MASHSTYECPHCSFTCSTQMQVRSHFRWKHPDEPMLRFEQSTSTSDGEKPETPEQQNEPSEFVCKKCGITVEDRPALLTHTKMVHNRNIYDCKLCRKLFRREHNLMKHMDSHSAHECSLCSFKCSTRMQLRAHFRFKHPDEQLVKLEQNTKEGSETLDLQALSTPEDCVGGTSDKLTEDTPSSQ